MKKLLSCMAILLFVFGTVGFANAVVIDFAGGIATLSNGTSVVTNNNTRYDNVDYYVEDGMFIDFVGGYGIIGNYYQDYTGVGTNNAVIHAHPFDNIDIAFSAVDNSLFDLNYVDMTSNTVTGGGAASGGERSYITNDSAYSQLLPSSDWGIEVLSNGTTPSDGIARLYLDSNFDGIASFLLSSTNAYCFGMDNFYINEPPPPAVPEPSTIFLLGTGLVGVAAFGRKKFLKK